MFSIGEFSYGTGLTVKTLRYYDEIGLLPAAEVDDYNGYRYYSAAQMEQATLLRLLRTAGTSIEQMRRVITHPHELADVVRKRQEEMEAQRALEDWALRSAVKWQNTEVSAVHTRKCPAQPWVGFATTIDVRELDDDTPVADRVGEKMEENLDRLRTAVAEAGLDAPDTEWWTELESDSKSPALVHVSMVMPTTREVPEEFAVHGVDLISGELPERIEAYVQAEVTPEEDDSFADLLPGGALPTQAVISLGKYLEECGGGNAPIRVTALQVDDGSGSTLFDLASTVEQ